MDKKEIEEISMNISNIYNDKIKTILDKISKEYNISNIELYGKYINKKTKPKSQLCDSNENICMARKQDGNQCTRRKKDGDYCGKHKSNQKFGRIDDYNNNLVDKLSQDDNYIMTWIEKFNNKEYLVDSNDVVYTNNLNNPEIIGKKISDNNIEFLNSLVN